MTEKESKTTSKKKGKKTKEEENNSIAMTESAIPEKDPKENKKKGIIIYFHTKEGKPFYKYMPLNIVTFKDVSEWQEQMIDL